MPSEINGRHADSRTRQKFASDCNKRRLLECLKVSGIVMVNLLVSVKTNNLCENIECVTDELRIKFLYKFHLLKKYIWVSLIECSFVFLLPIVH